MRVLYSILLAVGLTGCVSYQLSDAPNWRGKTGVALLKSWGKPSLVGSARNGNAMYAYISENHRRGPVIVSGPQAMGGTHDHSENKPLKLKCTILFEMDKNDIIVSTKSHGSC